jgi:hypothetical protein
MLVLVCLEIEITLTRGRCMICAERTVRSEIILDVPDGSPRRHWSCGISFPSIWRQRYCQYKIGALFALNVP